MKKLIFAVAALFLLMATVPAIISIPKINLSALSIQTSSDNTNSNESKTESDTDEDKKSHDFYLLEENGNVTGLSSEDMLTGAIAAVMPKDYGEESGYALAAAIYSRICYSKSKRESTETKTDLCKTENGKTLYLTKDEATEKYGEEFYALCQKYAQFGIATSLTYKSESINAQVFYSCAGATSSAEELLLEDIPCHISVASPWDKLMNTKSEKNVSAEDAEKLIKEKLDVEVLPDKLSDYIKIKSTDHNGAVLSAEVCTKSISGIEVMNIFSLKSPCFEVTADDDRLTFSVIGDGIPVGMSIVGANEMASQGAGWKEILMHYYPDCEIKTY